MKRFPLLVLMLLLPRGAAAAILPHEILRAPIAVERVELTRTEATLPAPAARLWTERGPRPGDPTRGARDGGVLEPRFDRPCAARGRCRAAEAGVRRAGSFEGIFVAVWGLVANRRGGGAGR